MKLSRAAVDERDRAGSSKPRTCRAPAEEYRDKHGTRCHRERPGCNDEPGPRPHSASCGRRPIAARVGRGAELECRILHEYLLLQLAKRQARLEPEPLDQQRPRLRVDRERVSLAPRAVESEHQLPAKAFVQRMRPNQAIQFANEPGMPPQREVALDPLLERREAQLLEPARLGEQKSVAGSVRERVSAPQRKCLLQSGRSLARPALSERSPASFHELAEAIQVKLPRLDPQHVARRTAHQPPVAERFAEP